ncbi:MAG: hypothetical protein EP329_12345 [Deltaproteobacteria bacterium]|nr:MAG: hypothetical protein EP329_12345 [Deltaproteobacteria bacterium]
MRPTALALPALLALTLAACPADKKPLSIGSACVSDGQCNSGLCLAETCVDPEADDDGDTLVNRIEGALGTNPFLEDSDGDGVSDAAEVVDANSPADQDGDGKNDAIESATADQDLDCVPDQRDPQDDVKEEDVVEMADLSCCCEGRCSEHGYTGVTAECRLIEDGKARELVCTPAQVNSDDDDVPDACDDDADNDGVANALDNCVAVANEDQVDIDQDGLGDACDEVDNRFLYFSAEEVGAYCDFLCGQAEQCQSNPPLVGDCAGNCRDQVDQDGWWLANYACLSDRCDVTCLEGNTPMAERSVCRAACDTFLGCGLAPLLNTPVAPSRDYCRAWCTGVGGTPEADTVEACLAAVPHDASSCDFFSAAECLPEFDVCGGACERVKEGINDACAPEAAIFDSWPDEATCRSECEARPTFEQIALIGCALPHGCGDVKAACAELPTEIPAGCVDVCDAYMTHCPDNPIVNAQMCGAVCAGAVATIPWADTAVIQDCVAGLAVCDADDGGPSGFFGCLIGRAPQCVDGCAEITTCAAEVGAAPIENCVGGCTASLLEKPEEVEPVLACMDQASTCADKLACVPRNWDDDLCNAACDKRAECGALGQLTRDQCVDECWKNSFAAMPVNVCLAATASCNFVSLCESQAGPDATVPDSCRTACAGDPGRCSDNGDCELACQGALAAYGFDTITAECATAAMGASCDYTAISACVAR